MQAIIDFHASKMIHGQYVFSNSSINVGSIEIFTNFVIVFKLCGTMKDQFVADAICLIIKHF
jgi:hypothetical protein